jgi:hypothetical protein
VSDYLPAVAAGDGHLFLARQTEQGQRGRDLRQRMVVDVVQVVEVGPVRDPGDLTEPAGRVRLGDLLPRLGTEDAACLARARRDEREQFGNRSQVVVDQAWMDRLAVVAPVLGAGHPVAWIRGPAAEGGGVLGRRDGITQDVTRVPERGAEPVVEASQTLQSLLADRRPTQNAGLQLGAQVPLDGFSQPGLGELSG